jgi:hypothetical protein
LEERRYGSIAIGQAGLPGFGVAANVGCLMQNACEARMQGPVLKIVHPMDPLDLSYRRQKLDL